MVKINVYCRNGKELYCFHPYCNLLIYHFLKLTLQNLLSIQYCNGQVIFSIQWPLNLRFLICAVPISILRLSMLLLLHTILLLLTCSDINHIKSSWRKGVIWRCPVYIRHTSQGIHNPIIRPKLWRLPCTICQPTWWNKHKLELIWFVSQIIIHRYFLDLWKQTVYRVILEVKIMSRMLKYFNLDAHPMKKKVA